MIERESKLGGEKSSYRSLEEKNEGRGLRFRR